jgi:Fe-S cluster biogenesis protein NfuA
VAQGTSRPSSPTASCAACAWASTSTLQFESETSMRYQIQEMLRIEKIFEEEGIEQEIEAMRR